MTCHLVRIPGDRKVACGFLSATVPTGWARFMGAHEIGRAFHGRPLPDWCPDCILALAPRPSQPKRKRTSTVTPRGNPTRPTLFDAD